MTLLFYRYKFITAITNTYYTFQGIKNNGIRDISQWMHALFKDPLQSFIWNDLF